VAVYFATAHTFTRYNAGTYVNASWTPAATPSTAVTINGNVQGAGSKDVDLIVREFGESVDGLVVLRSNEEVYTASKSPARRPDRLTWQGRTYEVIRTEYRGTIAAMAHYRSHLRIVDNNAENGII